MIGIKEILTMMEKVSLTGDEDEQKNKFNGYILCLLVDLRDQFVEINKTLSAINKTYQKGA